ncbi:hypothetical protein SAY87_002901 [Trapa incisa]|uniref:Transcription termination factor MTERF2, chloroplastic n=1 Tax=Trapa incisa TaxID=236973 RepID=A0AAN7KJN8_9MYRT|nr:hypothetical protein SAY87_002901 [Trapa incisa]
MPISLSTVSLESASAAAIPSKASPCCQTPPPSNLFITRRHGGGRATLSAPKNHGPLRTQPRKPLRPVHLSSSHHTPPADPEAAAKEALSEYFHGELGLSEEESVSIVSMAPKFLATLIDDVKELDELPQLWGEYGYQKGDDSITAADGGHFGDGYGFKEKVIYMAKQKGDGGKAAFLESLGLSLPSATYIARLLSLETLPSIIHKVKTMKEMFFPARDGSHIVGKNARRLMMSLLIPVDEDVQQTLSFFEKIEAKRGGLEILGDGDAAFPYLVESFPRLLLLSVDSHLKPMTQFLQRVGVHGRSSGYILLLFPPILFYDVKSVKNRLLVFDEVGPAEDMGKLLIRYPWVLSSSIQKNYKEIISFFEMERVPRVFIDHAIKSWPHVLGCSTGKLRSMTECLGDLNVRGKMLGKVIAKSPQILLRKPGEFHQVVSLFEEVGFNSETTGKILVRCPEIFAASVEKTLKKKLNFLASIGISKDHLPRVIKKYPEVLVSDIERTLLPRMNYLMEIGLSKREVISMLRRFSPLLGYSIEEVLRPKVEFLVNTMEKPLQEVVEYPRYFSYSLEKKIKPRHWVLKGRGIKCSLKDALSKNNEEFAAEFMGVGSPPPP